MKYNIFIVAGPLHIMNAIEAIEYFNTKNNILIILYTENKTQLNQMKKLLSFSNWYSIQYIPLPKKYIDKLFYVKNISNYLKDLNISTIEKVFVGEYRSDHVNHIVNYFKNRNIYLLDDGLAQLSYHEEINRETYKIKSRRLIYKLWGYKLKNIKYTFFTMFNIPNEKVIKNNYSFFKKYIGKKKKEDSIYFIGQPLVELKIITKENYKKELEKILKFYSKMKFIYILHRREDIANIKELSVELGFEYKEFDTLIELEMINSNIIPTVFATFFSTAIVTLPSFIKDSEYIAFRSQNRVINKKFIKDISATYEELNNMGLKVVEL